MSKAEIFKEHTIKNEIHKKLFNLKDFYNYKHQELKTIGIQVKKCGTTPS